jgi:hypothetical protein
VVVMAVVVAVVGIIFWEIFVFFFFSRVIYIITDPLFNVKSGAESEASELRFSLTPRQFGIRSEREQVL